jgi:hypothetical protein
MPVATATAEPPDEPAELRRREGGADAGRERHVLDGDRKPVQRAERPAGAHGHLGGARKIARLLGHQRDDRVELRIEPRDHREMGVEHLERADLAGADQRRELARRFTRQGDVGHAVLRSGAYPIGTPLA